MESANIGNKITINRLTPRQTGRHFPDDIFKCIFNKNAWILITISLKFFTGCPINNIPALVKIKAWRCPRDKPLFEQMMFGLITHICVTRPQWVKYNVWLYNISYTTTKGIEMYLYPVSWHKTNSTICFNYLHSSNIPPPPPPPPPPSYIYTDIWIVFLNHCGLVMPYGSTFVQEWFVAWQQ